MFHHELLPAFRFVHLLTDAIIGVGDDDVSSAGRDEDFSTSLAVVDIVFSLLVGLEPDSKPYVAAPLELEIQVAVVSDVVVVDASVCPERHFHMYGLRANRIE